MVWPQISPKTIVAQGTVQSRRSFEINLIQIKGGGAKRPDKSKIKRLGDVAKHHNARDVVFAEWVKGNQLKFNWLVHYRADPKKAWERSIREYCSGDLGEAKPYGSKQTLMFFEHKP